MTVMRAPCQFIFKPEIAHVFSVLVKWQPVFSCREESGEKSTQSPAGVVCVCVCVCVCVGGGGGV